jgi:hypothetical protein
MLTVIRDYNKNRYLEFIFVIAFEYIFLFLTIFPSAIVNKPEKSLQYSSTIICQGFFDKCCSPWTNHCMEQKIIYWAEMQDICTMQSTTTHRITQILGFFLHLLIGAVVLLILCRHPIIVRKKTSKEARTVCINDVRISYVISAVSVLLAFAVTEHIPQPFGPISRGNFVMMIEMIIPPLLLFAGAFATRA